MVFNLFTLFGNGSRKRYGGGSAKAHTRANVEQEWRNIDVLMQQKSPSALRQAMISADKTLDNVLRDRVSGEKMGERLKNAEKLFDRPLYNKVWQAHKMRNSLVHESGYEPPHHMLTNGIETLRTAVIRLGVRV